MAITGPEPPASSPASARRWKAAEHRGLDPLEVKSRKAHPVCRPDSTEGQTLR